MTALTNTRTVRSTFALALFAVVASLYALAAQGGMHGVTFGLDGGIAHLVALLRISPYMAGRIVDLVNAGLTIARIAAVLGFFSGALAWAVSAVSWWLRRNRAIAIAL
jgi:hypothetical protein